MDPAVRTIDDVALVSTDMGRTADLLDLVQTARASHDSPEDKDASFIKSIGWIAPVVSVSPSSTLASPSAPGADML